LLKYYIFNNHYAAGKWIVACASVTTQQILRKPRNDSAGSCRTTEEEGRLYNKKMNVSNTTITVHM
jgi:hypothetical protein